MLLLLKQPLGVLEGKAAETIGELRQLIEPPIPYNFDNGPAEVRDLDTARREGINCIGLAHIALEVTDHVRLVNPTHCYETYSDRNGLFITVKSPEEMVGGEWVWFGLESNPVDSFVPQYNENGYLVNYLESPVSHAAVYTGQQENDDYLLLHATYGVGSVIWPLQRILENNPRRYDCVKHISRLALG